MRDHFLMERDHGGKAGHHVLAEGAAGAQEAIYSLLMLHNGFAAESAHIENLDPAFEGMPILRKRHDGELTTVMSNSFGFGGTNASVIFKKVVD